MGYLVTFDSSVCSLVTVQKVEAFYTGGNIQISKDGQYMFCGIAQQVKILELETAKTTCTVGQEDEEITSFCVSPDDKFLVLATQNCLLRKWKWKSKELVHTWKALHATPVMSMGFDPTSTLLATGGSDFIIKLWDCIQQYCTHHLRGHTGVVRLVRFHPDITRLQLVSAADDDSVRVWGLKTSSCLMVSTHHHSLVRDLSFTDNGQTMYSCGQDKVVCVWDMDRLKVIRTLPVFESSAGVMVLENLPVLEDGDAKDYFVCVGSDGALRVVHAKTGKCIHTDRSLCEERSGEESKDIIVQAFRCPALDCIVVVTYDHNILFIENDFTVGKQLSGHLEEVLDMAPVGKEGSHLVVVSNSSKVKVFDRHTMQCQILSGHTDTVLAVTVCPKQNLFATASKDNQVRIWKMDPNTFSVTCVAAGEGHAKAVTTVAFSRLSAKFIVSGSEDQTIKLWKVPPGDVKHETERLATLHSCSTEWAHQDDINCIAISPNDLYLASASRDKTAKLWSLPDLKLQGVVRGHKRGVWCVQFSDVDKCFATSSADGKINIWNMADFSLMQSLEGHNSSVLKVIYISGGRQLLSSDSEGLLKLWTLKTSTCEKTFEAHANKAWALAVLPGEEDLIISGGADSTLIIWKDTTDEEVQLARETAEKQILQEQKLQNLLQQKKFLKAIGLAITLERPYTVLNIIKNIMKTPTGFEDLEKLCKLKPHQIGSLLRYASQWNTNTHHCQGAQVVVNILLKGFPVEELLALPDFRTSFEGLLPYTERHFQRTDGHQLQATFADYTLQCMKKGV
ncbi:hypothetical protein ACOMHN_050010 [Nucella lapillus]